MGFIDELGPGLWLVKWIDRFRFGKKDSESAWVNVYVQSLGNIGVDEATKLSSMDVEELIAEERDNSLPKKLVHKKEMLVGSLPKVTIGQLHTPEKGLVGRLLPQTRTVKLSAGCKTLWCRKGDHVPPLVSAQRFRSAGRGPSVPLALDPLEYTIGPRNVAEDSLLLLFERHGIEYIIPSIVIFQTFYGFSSHMANAVCNDPWASAAKELISFDRYESGITTAEDEASGTWKIVLKPGVGRELAAPLALLLFDDDWRKCANMLHTGARSQTQSLPSAAPRYWDSNAAMPAVWEKLPFTMRLTGYPLRASPPDQLLFRRRRFLVTAITTCSWSRPDRSIEVALSVSPDRGVDRLPSAEDEAPFGTLKTAVEGDPTAQANMPADPNPAEALNIFTLKSFSYLTPPKIRDQIKDRSKDNGGSSKRAPGSPAPIVSPGSPGSSSSTPAPADFRKIVREPSEQFQFLLDALEELQATMRITYKLVGPTDNEALEVVMNGCPCWSLLKPEDRPPKPIPHTGWEVVKVRARTKQQDQRIAAWRQQDQQGKPSLKAAGFNYHARSLLLCEVAVGRDRFMVAEIEPRCPSEWFPTIGFRPIDDFTDEDMSSVLDLIRNRHGQLKETDFRDGFARVAEGPAFKIRHRYEYEAPSQEVEEGSAADRKQVGHNPEKLFNRLRRQIQHA